MKIKITNKISTGTGSLVREVAMKIKHLFLAAVLFTLLSLHINAATITVANTSDSGAGSLRQAISDAAPGDTINFNVTGTITLTSGQMVIDKNLTIQGPGAGLLSISGNNATRVFLINSGVTVTLDRITIRSGYASQGGGIRNSGTLSVRNSILSENNAPDVDFQGAYGGGISNFGALSVTNTTISNNHSDLYGGGFYNAGLLTVINSTISSNTASNGGGISTVGPETTIFNSTISSNTASNAGGGISSIFGAPTSTETLKNTIVAGNPNGDIGTTIETASHNLIGDVGSSGGIQNGVNGNIVGLNPLLGPLQNNGGPTMTHALLPGSPAINAGDNCVLTANGCGNGNPALPTDQRGVPRNGPVDIGAFERQPRSATPFDFDGDGRSDISVFRPSDRTWYLNRSTAGFSATQFGLSADKITPADFDGDGKTDISVYRDGTWYWLNSSTGSFAAYQFGLPSDVPVPADYTGDGRSDLAIYRGGVWWTLDLSNGQSAVTNFGIATDKPVPADYDGDGKTDIAIYRDGTWWRINSGTGTVEVLRFGLASDRPVVGDYDGDSKADLAVYRDGIWYLQQSSQGFTVFQFGVATDIPTPADYDGDGKTDAAVYRNGTWYVLKSTGGVSIQQFGLANDKPIPAAYVR